MRSTLLGALSISVFSIAFAAACSSGGNSGTFLADGGVSPGPGDTANLPKASPKDLGGECTGYGTSIGDTAAFPTDDCPAGMCAVDARKGIDLYCSVDCSKFQCPTGYLCETTTVGKRTVCFKDPNAPIEEPDDKVDAAPPDLRDVKLPGFRPGSATSVKISLREFQDKTHADNDLVVLLVGGAWEPYTAKALEDPTIMNISRVQWINVLADGAQPNQTPTQATITAWRDKHPDVTIVVDPQLTTYEPLYSKAQLDALPTFIALDAATLQPVGETEGVSNIPQTVETWRSAVK